MRDLPEPDELTLALGLAAAAVLAAGLVGFLSARLLLP
jgi:hypothetical protein